jgi:hypothetical protein
VSKRTLLAASAAIAAVVIAGGAIAATKLTSPKEENQAVINDAAAQLGIEPSKLSDALENALKAQVDNAVADGRLTKEQGDKLKESIDAGEVPLFATPGFGFGPHGFQRGFHVDGPFEAGLSTAAKYLGMSEADLRSALRNGKSLADVAKDKGKSVDGLIDALVAVAEEKWDAAVASGKIQNHTAEDKKEFLEGVRERVTDLVKGRFPELPDWHAFRPAPGFAPPGWPDIVPRHFRRHRTI